MNETDIENESFMNLLEGLQKKIKEGRASLCCRDCTRPIKNLRFRNGIGICEDCYCTQKEKKS